MTLHVMSQEHYKFVVDCHKWGGASEMQARQEAQQLLELALAFPDPLFFVGPSAEAPRYYMGVYLDVTNRAYLQVGTTGFIASEMYKDVIDWLSYLFDTLGIKLIEANVWVEDLQKEWFMRAVGFKKAGVIPDKLDIPGKGSVTALCMYLRPQEFSQVTRESFHAIIKKYQAHRKRLRDERVS